MTRKNLVGTAMTLALLVAGPQQTAAQFWTPETECSGGTLNACVDFELWTAEAYKLANPDVDVVGEYVFVVRYLGSDGTPEGMLTAAGLYDIDGEGDNPWEFSGVTLINPTSGWTVWDNDDTDKKLCPDMSGGGNALFEGCITSEDGITTGVPDYVAFSFSSNKEISSSSFAYVGDLGARARIQGVGEEDCSFKLDSPQGLVSGCGGEVVPEPMTVILLATGLVGIGAVGYRNRRKEEQEEV